MRQTDNKLVILQNISLKRFVYENPLSYSQPKKVGICFVNPFETIVIFQRKSDGPLKSTTGLGSKLPPLRAAFLAKKKSEQFFAALGALRLTSHGVSWDLNKVRQGRCTPDPGCLTGTGQFGCPQKENTDFGKYRPQYLAVRCKFLSFWRNICLQSMQKWENWQKLRCSSQVLVLTEPHLFGGNNLLASRTGPGFRIFMKSSLRKFHAYDRVLFCITLFRLLENQEGELLPSWLHNLPKKTGLGQ